MMLAILLSIIFSGYGSSASSKSVNASDSVIENLKKLNGFEMPLDQYLNQAIVRDNLKHQQKVTKEEMVSLLPISDSVDEKKPFMKSPYGALYLFKKKIGSADCAHTRMVAQEEEIKNFAKFLQSIPMTSNSSRVALEMLWGSAIVTSYLNQPTVSDQKPRPKPTINTAGPIDIMENCEKIVDKAMAFVQSVNQQK